MKQLPKITAESVIADYYEMMAQPRVNTYPQYMPIRNLAHEYTSMYQVGHKSIPDIIKTMSKEYLIKIYNIIHNHEE